MANETTVMVVDDNEDFLEVAAEALSMLGYGVEAISDPEAALRRVARPEEFDLLVVDLRLGGQVSGVTVAQRAREASPDLPVILLTGDPTGVETEADALGEVVSKTDGFTALRDALLRATGRDASG